MAQSNPPAFGTAPNTPTPAPDTAQKADPTVKPVVVEATPSLVIEVLTEIKSLSTIALQTVETAILSPAPLPAPFDEFEPIRPALVVAIELFQFFRGSKLSAITAKASASTSAK